MAIARVDPYGPDPYADPLAGAIRTQTQSQYSSPGQPVTDAYQPPGTTTTPTSTQWQRPAGSNWDTDGYAAPSWFPDQYNPTTPAGWDQTKWSDPNYMSPKYAVGKILSNYPANVGGLTKAYEDIKKAFPGATYDGKDKLMIPGVGTIDVGQAFSTTASGQYGPDVTTAWQWIPVLDQYGNVIPQDGGTGVGGAPIGGAGGTGGGGAAGNWWSQFGGDVSNKLREFLNMDPSNVSVRDQDIAPVAQTHDAALQRARNMAQAQMAEQAAQDGTLGAGGFDTDVQRTFTDFGNAQAGFEAGLVNDKMKERRAQIMQALQLGSGLLDNEMQRKLQMELAQIDDATRRMGLTMANSQFYDNLGMTQAQFEAIQNANMVNNLMSGLYGGGF
jgi:hypothetical protein